MINTHVPYTYPYVPLTKNTLGVHEGTCFGGKGYMKRYMVFLCNVLIYSYICIYICIYVPLYTTPIVLSLLSFTILLGCRGYRYTYTHVIGGRVHGFRVHGTIKEGEGFESQYVNPNFDGGTPNRWSQFKLFVTETFNSNGLRYIFGI